MLENLYTTKMSADKKKLQNRFMIIRKKYGKSANVLSVFSAVVFTVVLGCAAVAMAVFEGVEFTNGRLVFNEKESGINIVHIENKLATHTDAYYVPLRQIFEMLGYEVRYDVDKSEYEHHMGRYTFPVYDSGFNTIHLESGKIFWVENVNQAHEYGKEVIADIENPDEWKRAFVKNDVLKYIYGSTMALNWQMPIIEMIKDGKTEYCQIGSSKNSIGYLPPPVLIDGVAYIPLRAVAYIVGGDTNVKWEEEKKDTFYKGVLTFDESEMLITIKQTLLDVFTFTDEEVESARKVVKDYFKAKAARDRKAILKTLTPWHAEKNVILWHNEKTTLKNISYDPFDPVRKSYVTSGRGSVNGTDIENVIVLKVDYDIEYPEGMEYGPYSEGEYRNWSMILVRDKKGGQWFIDDQGW